MRTDFTRKHGLYLLAALCCVGAIYFYPFLSSSITWMRNSHFRYENRTEVKLPFRWISGEGGGLALVKPAATITSYVRPRLDTSLHISDNSGSDSKPDDQGRARMLHAFNMSDTRATPNEPTYPFTSAGLLCTHIDKRTTKPSDMVFIVCLSSDSRYFIQFMGREEDIREAGEIAKQVIQ